MHTYSVWVWSFIARRQHFWWRLSELLHMIHEITGHMTHGLAETLLDKQPHWLTNTVATHLTHWNLNHLSISITDYWLHTFTNISVRRLNDSEWYNDWRNCESFQLLINHSGVVYTLIKKHKHMSCVPNDILYTVHLCYVFNCLILVNEFYMYLSCIYFTYLFYMYLCKISVHEVS